jgi:hypothetical protein
VPIQNVSLEPNQQVAFAGGLVLTNTPAWVLKETMLDSLSEWDRRAVKECSSALVATYDAAALGDPDPTWVGPEPKSIQESKYELCLLANLALWLSRPSPVQFSVVLHAPQFGAEPIGQRMSRHSPLLCHPQDVDAQLSDDDITLATQLHASLATVARDTSIWTAIRATWSGLQLNVEHVRYVLFWIALEALFGPDDAREMTFRLSQRIALFLGKDRAEARELFAVAKRGYGFRSRVVHGRWREEPDSLARMAEAEDLVRRSFLRILLEKPLMTTFSGKAREPFLDELVF